MDLKLYKECKAHKNAIFIGNDDAPFRPCCWFKGQIDASSYEEYQEKLSQMDIEKNCSYCIEMESNGGDLSPRTHYAEPNNENFITVSISFDNLCNLKCITCSPTNSSQLAIEIENPNLKKKYISIQKQEPIKTAFLKKMLSSVNFSSRVTRRATKINVPTFENVRIEILGGEPLINPAVYNFLDWLVEQPYAHAVQISITSNGTTFDDRIIKYIERFCSFSIQLSIDGVEDTLEYIRFGSKFSGFKEVTDKFYELRTTYSSKFRLTFNYTLSWMNALHIDEFFNWVNVNYPDVDYILVTKLEWPNKYAINLLSNELRTEIVEKVSNNISSNKSVGVKIGFDYYKQHMLTTPVSDQSLNNLKAGIDTLSRNDKLINRNSDFNKTFKSILDLLKTNNSL
jgi:molybdenum cofactor biosynthesis enzyme MoaA